MNRTHGRTISSRIPRSVKGADVLCLIGGISAYA
jgi:hypothetical protein